ncbi:MAG: porin [Bermanella sp.]
MKKPLIAAAISMALVGTAQAESQFYGKMNVSASYNDSTESFDLNNHASRLGVKGSSDLGSTKVIYQAEFSNPTDTGGLSSRDTYVGLAYSGMGTVKMGKMDTPLKKSQGKFDLFNDVIDIKNVLDGENRMNNSINYTSEKMGALQVSVSAILNDTNEGAASDTDGYSASVTFNQDAIYAAVAYDTKVKDESVQRATFIYNMGDLSVGALINNVDKTDTADDELGFGVNASMKMNANTLKAQYVTGDQQGSPGASNLSVGVDHKLAKTTKAYFYATASDSDAPSSDVTALLAGLEHKF